MKFNGIFKWSILGVISLSIGGSSLFAKEYIVKFKNKNKMLQISNAIPKSLRSQVAIKDKHEPDHYYY